ncbi:MAG: hypothetical protein GXO75_05280 [Calditrichaeota bacterium]|nr:hypothetical protein [Calditrichota bacterium]
MIKEKNILSCKNGMVTFRFLNSKTKTYQYKTIPAVDFIWLVIKHVLPRGFRRARNYGFLHSNSKRMIRMIQWIFRMHIPNLSHKISPRKKKTCPRCGAPMNIVMLALPASRIPPAQTEAGIKPKLHNLCSFI